MTTKRPISVLRNGETLHFTAIMESDAGSVTARIEGMAGLVAAGDNIKQAMTLLQGALILHLDGCEEDGIDPFQNDPDVPGLEDIL